MIRKYARDLRDDNKKIINFKYCIYAGAIFEFKCTGKRT